MPFMGAASRRPAQLPGSPPAAQPQTADRGRHPRRQQGSSGLPQGLTVEAEEGASSRSPNAVDGEPKASVPDEEGVNLLNVDAAALVL